MIYPQMAQMSADYVVVKNICVHLRNLRIYVSK